MNDKKEEIGMEGTFFTQERKLKGLRLCYLVIGCIVLSLGLFIAGSGIVVYYTTPQTGSLFLLMVAFFGPICLSSGALFIVTYYGLRKRLRFARFTGVAGSFIFLGIFVINWLVSLSDTLHYFDLAYSVIWALFLLVPVLLLLSTFLLWNDIQGEARLQPRIKKILAAVAIAIVVLAVLVVTIPDVNKKLVLGSLKYTNYDKGFGFNPPEGWTLESFGEPSCSPPIGANASSKLFLEVTGPIHTVSGAPISTEEMRDDYRATFSVLENRTANHTANFSLLSEHERIISGIDAYEFVMLYRETYNNVTGPLTKDKLIVFAKDNSGWMIDYKGWESIYGTYEDAAERSINSMRFV
jgi:hypothetical protein